MKQQCKVAVLVSSTNSLFREGMQVILGAQPAVHLAGEAQRLSEAVEKSAQLHPDVLLLDMAAGDEDASVAIRRMKRANRRLKIIALSVTGNVTREAGCKAGATEFLDSGATMADLLRIIQETTTTAQAAPPPKSAARSEPTKAAQSSIRKSRLDTGKVA